MFDSCVVASIVTMLPIMLRKKEKSCARSLRTYSSPGNNAMMSTVYQDTANSFQGSGVTPDTVQSNIKLSLPFAQAYADTTKITQNSRNVLRTSCKLDSSLAAFVPTLLPLDSYDIEGAY